MAVSESVFKEMMTVVDTDGDGKISKVTTNSVWFFKAVGAADSR